MRRAGDDFLQFRRRIHLQTAEDPETVAQRRRKHSGARRRADQRKPFERKTDISCRRTLPDDNVERVILHCGIQNFFHRTVETVNFVDKQNIPFVEIGKDRRQIARTFDGWSARHFDLRSHRVGDDVRQRRLAQSGGTVQQDMIERIAARLRRRHIHG